MAYLVSPTTAWPSAPRISLPATFAYKVNVKLPDGYGSGDMVQMDIHPDEVVQALKQRLEEYGTPPACACDLRMGGQILEEDESFKSQDIEEGAVLTLHVQATRIEVRLMRLILPTEATPLKVTTGGSSSRYR